ncbi:hypothetical protein LEMA_P067230.1 [Plenodomus lingam JN3]|uniref:AAA+ ATPase domain-containing protein n=1 Tax=Leptosphaeria maculans (strain JN3 / isolate v23.1.3 / race Av1-4-5-6-7-8) TaxID=985895 RepID=E4ZIU5_LEPMJ|nr:hypothetical protein LEMA_P067230.1 [Plenodomus lingam JN3]CBX91215.1 hypothetical protein LEMA_P067230.1 [Plenodomus lingam JN3]
MTLPVDHSVTTLLEKLNALEQQVQELEKKTKSVQEPPLTPTKTVGIQEGKPEHDQESGGKKASNASEETGPNSRVQIIKKTINRETGEQNEVEETRASGTESEDTSKRAFILRKMIPERFSDHDPKSEIDIVNPHLWDLLKKHLGDYPYHMFRGGPLTIPSPFEAIVFAWDTLEKVVVEPTDDSFEKQAREDLGLLLGIISGGSSGDPKLDRYFKGRKVNTEERTVQYDNLWTIFPPGCLVYGKPFQNQDQLFVVRDNLRTWPFYEDTNIWKLDAWTFDWTGDKFERTCLTLSIEQYEGQEKIITLPFYPFEFHPEYSTGRIQNELLERGKKLRKLSEADQGARMFDYNGDCIFGQKGFSGLQNDDENSDTQSQNSFFESLGLLRRRGHRAPPSELTRVVHAKSTHVNSRIMVDPLSYFQYGPPVARNGTLEPSHDDWNCTCADCKNNDGLAKKYRTEFDSMSHSEDWDDEMYMLCPPRTLGYILAHKQWAQLQISSIQDIPPDDPDNAWNSRLQLADDETKQLLFNLVRSHNSFSSDDSQRNVNKKYEAYKKLEVNDIVPGKGKGLVILLYGPPGVGKTSTAETIAVATRKPLFSISVADVGTKARHVEANLSKIFSLATKWQAILLIDEADVFLESRKTGAGTSTDKNALVSVFLRVLEYYQGIMFLTTNQIAQFDVAIPSRIHLSVQYETLKKPQMEKIFKGFLEPLNEQGLVKDYEKILEWLKEDVYPIGFDGRQIRNIVTTALVLSRADAQYGKAKAKLTKSHLKLVVNNSRAFKNEFIKQYDRYLRSQDDMIS